jgi:hypothetical protein
MSVRVTIDVSQRLVISTFSGELNEVDLLSFYSLIRSHPDFDPSYSEIVDFSAVTSVSVSSSAVQEASQRPSNFYRTSTHVVIAPQDHIFGLARMSQVFAEKTRPNAVVVRTISEAREFLTREQSASD